MHRYIIVVCILFAGCYGCKKKKAEAIIPPGQFGNVLYDMHLADGLYSISSGNIPFHTDSINFYSDVLKEYGYTKTQFDSALRWYARHPAILDEIYSELTSKFNAYDYEATQLNMIVRDTLSNLYKAKQKWILPKDGLTKRIPFDVPVSDSCEYKIYVFVKRFADDQSEDMQITAYYWYADSISKTEHKSYFPETQIEKGKRFNLYTSSKFLSDKRVKRLRGWILDHTNASDHFNKHAEVKVIAIRKHKVDVNL
jgi:hypothetical protein